MLFVALDSAPKLGNIIKGSNESKPYDMMLANTTNLTEQRNVGNPTVWKTAIIIGLPQILDFANAIHIEDT